MTVAALLKFVQGATVGTAGQALICTLTDGAVTISNNVNTGVTGWSYVLEDCPPASALTRGPLSSLSTASLTPDAPGSYRVSLTVVGPGGPQTDTRSIIVRNSRGWILPPAMVEFGQGGTFELNYGGQDRGWSAPYWDTLADLENVANFAISEMLFYTDGDPPLLLEVGTLYIVDTSGAPVEDLTLPANPLNGQAVAIKDGRGAAGANPITVLANAGQQVEQLSAPGTFGSSTVLDTNGIFGLLVWVDSYAQWMFAVNGGGSGGGSLAGDVTGPAGTNTVVGLTHAASNLTFTQAADAVISPASGHSLSLTRGGGSTVVKLDGLSVKDTTIETVAAAVLTIGPTTATGVAIGKSSTVTEVKGQLLVDSNARFGGPSFSFLTGQNYTIFIEDDTGDQNTLTITNGTTSNPSGSTAALLIHGADDISGCGGSFVSIDGGQGANAPGGGVAVTGGFASGVSGIGGNVQIDGGAAPSNPAAQGSVSVAEFNAIALTLGRSGKPVTIKGDPTITGAGIVWGPSVTTAGLSQTIHASGAGSNMALTPQRGHTAGTHKSGDLTVEVGPVVSNVSAKLSVLVSSASILDISQTAAATTTVKAPAGSLALDASVAITMGGINVFVLPSGFASIAPVGDIYLDAGSGTFHLRKAGTDYASLTMGVSPVLQFTTLATGGAKINYADITTTSATGATVTVQAQNATGLTSTGGDLNLSPGTGTMANGYINLQNVLTTTTTPGAGGFLLPATAAGFYSKKINGTIRQIAYY